MKVSPKYQVVIPKEVRRNLGLKIGSEVDVIVKGKIAYIVPVTPLSNLQKEFSGKLNLKKIRDKKDRL